MLCCAAFCGEGAGPRGPHPRNATLQLRQGEPLSSRVSRSMSMHGDAHAACSSKAAYMIMMTCHSHRPMGSPSGQEDQESDREGGCSVLGQSQLRRNLRRMVSPMWERAAVRVLQVCNVFDHCSDVAVQYPEKLSERQREKHPSRSLR